MAQTPDKPLTAEQQKIMDFIKDINAKVNACEKDWNRFEDLCWSTLRGLNLWLMVGAVDPGTKKPTTYEKFSLDQILSEIDGTAKTIYSYFREHEQTSNGDHEIELRGHNKDNTGSVRWAVAPTINLKKQATTKAKPGTAPTQAAGPTSLTKDILTALPSIVSAVQLLAPKPPANNDSKLILDFVKFQQENTDRLQDQRKEDRKEIKELVSELANQRSPIQELAELEEFRQTVTTNSRPATPPLIGGGATATTSAWDRLADLGGKYLESAMAAHSQRQATVEQTAAKEEVIDAKRAEISELAEPVNISVYLQDLAQLIKTQVEPVAVLKGIQETLTFAKETGQLEKIEVLTANDYDLELALLDLMESSTDDADYVQAVMSAASPFVPLLAAEMGIIRNEEPEAEEIKTEESKIEGNGKASLELDNTLRPAVTAEEPNTQAPF